MLHAKQDGKVCDAETFDHLRAIRLIPSISGMLKFKLYQMDVHNSSLNSYLNM